MDLRMGPSLLVLETRGNRRARKGTIIGTVRSWFGIIAVWLASLSSAALGAGIPGKIAFIGIDHQVYLADPNGGEPRALTRGEAGRMADAPARALPASYAQGQPPGSCGYGYAIVTHTGGAREEDHPADVALIDVRGARQGGKPHVTKLSTNAVMFRAPA